MKWRALITCPHLQRSIDRYRHVFDEHGIEIELPHLVQQLGEVELLDIIDRFDGVITGDDEFTARVLERGGRLKVIAKWGIGLDAIDLAAAKRLGIRVINTPNAFAGEVADVAMGYIILLARQLHKLDQSVRNGGWAQVQGISLEGKSLGIIGMGNIGRSLARRAATAGMAISGYDIVSVPEAIASETGLKMTDLDRLIRTSDFISLHCNLTPENRHILGSREFGLMKPGVFIVNCSRGPLIDEAALVKALESGRVAGAALDVFEQEPLPQESPLRKFDNIIFGTHNGSNTSEAVARVNELAIGNLIDGLEKA